MFSKRNILIVIAIALIALIAGTGGAIAGATIGSAGITDDSVRTVDLKNGKAVGSADLRPGLYNKIDDAGKDSFLNDAYYAKAVYDVGDTNAGAIATVACKAETDVAISGGVQTLGLDAEANSRNTPVSSSFPGRMDWSTNAPKVDRLDGWIVQFGGNAGAVSDKDPLKVTVYALCVPELGHFVGSEVTYQQSS